MKKHKLDKIGPKRLRFCGLSAIKHTSLKKAHHRWLWRLWKFMNYALQTLSKCLIHRVHSSCVCQSSKDRWVTQLYFVNVAVKQIFLSNTSNLVYQISQFWNIFSYFHSLSSVMHTCEYWVDMQVNWWHNDPSSGRASKKG